MLTRHLVTAIFVAGLSGSVIAEGAHHPEAQAAQPPAAALGSQDSVPVRQADMHARMMRMHDEMAKIMAATGCEREGTPDGRAYEVHARGNVDDAGNDELQVAIGAPVHA
jgi:hypothetical protein